VIGKRRDSSYVSRARRTGSSSSAPTGRSSSSSATATPKARAWASVRAAGDPRRQGRAALRGKVGTGFDTKSLKLIKTNSPRSRRRSRRGEKACRGAWPLGPARAGGRVSFSE
jgi:hypothetical protein